MVTLRALIGHRLPSWPLVGWSWWPSLFPLGSTFTLCGWRSGAGQAGWAWTWRFSLWPAAGGGWGGQAGPVLTGKETWCDGPGARPSLGSTSQCHGPLSPLSHFPTRHIRQGAMGWGSRYIRGQTLVPDKIDGVSLLFIILSFILRQFQWMSNDRAECRGCAQGWPGEEPGAQLWLPQLSFSLVGCRGPGPGVRDRQSRHGEAWTWDTKLNQYKSWEIYKILISRGG